MQVTDVYELSTPSFKKALKSNGIKLLHNMKLFVRVAPDFKKNSTNIDYYNAIVYVPSTGRLFIFNLSEYGNRKPSLKTLMECVKVVLNPPASFEKSPVCFIGEKRVFVMKFNSISKKSMYEDIYNSLIVGKFEMPKDVATKFKEKTVVYGFD